jgi:hypothetical protein
VQKATSSSLLCCVLVGVLPCLPSRQLSRRSLDSTASPSPLFHSSRVPRVQSLASEFVLPNNTNMFLPVLLAFSTALFPAHAHFNLNYPKARGFNDDDLGNGPCGGFDTPSNRTPVSTTSLALDLEMGHDQSAVQVLLGLGDDPGDNFNITLLPTFRQEGLGEFCLKEIPLPSNLGIEDGMNATLQVVTNGDPSGGLYNVGPPRAFVWGSCLQVLSSVRRYHLYYWYSSSSLLVHERHGRERKSLPSTSSCSERQRVNATRTSSEWIVKRKRKSNQQRHGSHKLTYRCGSCSERGTRNAWCCFGWSGGIALGRFCCLQESWKCAAFQDQLLVSHYIKSPPTFSIVKCRITMRSMINHRLPMEASGLPIRAALRS